jgi:membrane protein YdbS with pleckstrin-like domain
MNMTDPEIERTKRIALICLTLIVLVSLAGVVLLEIVTGNQVKNTVRVIFAVTLFIAILGGMSMLQIRRKHRWRVERETIEDDKNGKGD